MGSRKEHKWLAGMAMGIFLVALPSLALADWVDMLKKFKPRISIMEEYTSNLFLTSTNPEEDFITTISPGVTFVATEDPRAKFGLNLDYELGLVYYARNSDRDYVSHTGTVNTWYSFGNRWTLRLWDSYTRSQDPVERVVSVQTSPGVYYPGTQKGRFTYERNILEPSLTYQFGREDLLELIYRNNYYNTQNPDGDDSAGNNVTPRLTYWFNVNHGIILEYIFQTVDYQLRPDLNSGQRGRGRYTYRFDPQTSIFGQYIYDNVDYDSPGSDYYVNNPSVGITHSFTPTLSSRLQVGYFWRNPVNGKTIDGPTFDGGISQRTPRLTLDLTVQGGYSYDFFSSDPLGFTKYYRGIAYVSYRWAERLSSSLTGTLEWDEFPDQAGREDWFSRVEAGVLTYQPWRWFTMSLAGTYGRRDSNQDGFDYDEWRAFLRLTASYW
jgi:hypothetical protein